MPGCSRAIQLSLDDPTAFLGRGLANYEKIDFGGAIQDCDEAIRLKPEFAKAFYNRAVARKARRDEVGVVCDFEAAKWLDLKRKT